MALVTCQVISDVDVGDAYFPQFLQLPQFSPLLDECEYSVELEPISYDEYEISQFGQRLIYAASDPLHRNESHKQYQEDQVELIANSFQKLPLRTDPNDST